MHFVLLTALQIAALDLRARVAAAVLDRALVLLAHPAVRLALRVVLEIEEENAVVAKASMLREDMRIRRRKEIRRGKEKGIEIAIETGNGKRRRKRAAILSLTNLNLRDAQGM